MCLSEVEHVDKVADAGAVGRVVVIAEHGEAGTDADSRLREVGDKVSGNAIRHFADDARGVRADGVEVAKQDSGDRCAALHVVLHDFLVDLLCVAVGAFSLLDRGFFRNGQVFGIGLAVNGAGRREDDTLNVVLGHQFQEVNEAEKVVFVVHQGFLHAFAHCLGGGEVDNALNAGIFLENGFKTGEVAAVYFLEGGANARDFLNAVHDICLRVAEIVHNYNVVTGVLQFYGGVRTDETGTASHQNCLFHGGLIF